ncbi:MAG: YihY/virulence factor BrkB family protein [Cyclobacteriaceae bacterium]
MGKFKLKHIKNLLVDTAKSWMADEPFRQSAIISYFAIFSIPGLLIIVIWAAGMFFGEAAVQGEISSQIEEMMGPETAKGMESFISNSYINSSGWAMSIVGFGALLFGATTLFYHLQKSLNYLWNVEADPKSNIKKLIMDRVSSLGLILVIAFLLLISLVLSSILNILSGWIAGIIGEGLFYLMEGIDFILGFGIVTVLFAVMFKFLPDVDIKWRSVWIGAMVTALLFSIGKTLLGIYFGIADPTSGFGAAGTVIIVMLWVNYTCLILFFGAEFTQVFAKNYGHDIQPSKHAKWSDSYIMKREKENRDNALKEHENIIRTKM